MIEYLVFAVCAIIFLVVTILALMPGSRRNTTIPGPDVIDDLEGNFPEIKAAGSLHEFLTDMHGHYGPIVAFNYGHQFCVSVASPDLFKEQAKVFDRPGLLFELFEPLITSHSIQFANGGEGRQRHNAYSRSFSHDATQHYMDTLCQLSEELCTRWRGEADEEHLALGEHMNTFAVKSIMGVAFGQYMKGTKTALEFKKSYDLVWSEMENRLTGDAPDAKREAQFEICKQKMKDMLMVAYKEAKNNALPETDHRRFIEELLALDLSEDIVKGDMMTMCIGGFHTTGLLLTWCVYFLASHQDVQERVLEEMREVLGEETITFQAVAQLKYTRQVLNETLRCATLAPFAARVQDFDTELGGHQVPKGTPVVHALGVVFQDESIWPDPDRFDPERFSEENDIPQYAFEPFGFAGKRKCPGYRLSLLESTVLLSYLLRAFKVRLVEGQVVQKEYGLVTKPRDEVWITVQPRAAAS